MRSKRVRMKTGDVFLAPFDKNLAVYSDEFFGLWEPKDGEECFVMQNIGMNIHGSILTALYDGIYYYNSELIYIDVSSLKVVAIAELIPVSMTVGSFMKVSNQLIPESTPYMIYGYENKDNYYITYNTDDKRMSKMIPKEIFNDVPKYGLFLTGGYMHWISDYFIKGIRSEYLDDEVINAIRIREKAAVSNFLPEAKDSPNIAIVLHFESKGLIQDRDSYK